VKRKPKLAAFILFHFNSLKFNSFISVYLFSFFRSVRALTVQT